MLNNKLLIENIKKLCNQHNIKITNLEKELGFGAGIISRWGNDADPSLSKIIQIADYFHVSIDEVVGYNQNLNDEFLNKLYHQTEEKLISWKLVTNNSTTEYPNIKLFDVGADEYQLYDEEEYGQTHYVTKYNGGYIIMYSFYKYDFLLKPVSVRMFIQPTQESYLVEQHYPENTLTKLWIKILNSLGNDAPDEVKAEDLKNNFINTPENITNEKIGDFLNDPSLLKLIETVNTEEFQKIRKTFEDPQFKSAMQMVNLLQGYFNKGK